MSATFPWAIGIAMVLGLVILMLLRTQIKQLEGKVSDEDWKLLQVYQMDPQVRAMDMLASREPQPN